MSTTIKNVLMQQSYGPKITMPTSRPTGELLLALNEFNKYELYTGTDTSVQALFADGSGVSNISFDVAQESAEDISGKFVYFDEQSNSWKPAYATAIPSQNEHYTAQGFAIALNSTNVQITTSGKLILPFKLTDYTGSYVTAGSYYYLCQTEANAGLIQQAAPASGIMQIVCQVLAIDDTSTTIVLLNDLNQVANDIIVTDGDGSKYLGDDGQYHDMMVAGLAGRTSNCLNAYEILDINFENIAAGRSTAIAYEFPVLSANGTWDDTTEAAAISALGYDENNQQIPFAPTTIYTVTSGADITVTAINSVNSTITYKFLQSTFLTTITSINHTSSEQSSNNWNTAMLSYSDTIEGPWTSTNYTITNLSNTAGAQMTIEIPLELSKQWGAHKFWQLNQLTSFAGSTDTFAFNTLKPSGYYYTETSETPSYGYIANGDISIENNIASGWSKSNYVISKYLVNDYTQYSFRVRKKFDQVTNEDPIWQSPNKTNYLSIENGVLKFVLNNITYKGNLTYEPDVWYDFKINYNMSSGYSISIASGASDNPSWTNEIILYDDINYLTDTTWMLGIASIADEFTIGTGQIDLSHTGMDYVNGEQSFDTYPLSDLTSKNMSTITVSFKGTGLVAAGRSSLTTTLNAQEVDVDTTENTIILSNDATDLIWDTTKGLTTTNYSEVDYLRTVEDQETNTTVYAKDTNLCYSYTVVYPNFLQTGISFDTNEANDTILDFSGANASFHPNTFLSRNGFNFQLKLNLTGDLKLDRDLDARNYGSTQAYPFYYQVQGVDWTAFQTEGSFTQGIKHCVPLGNANTGTANGSAYQLTVNDANYTEINYGNQNLAGPGFIYFAFEKPIKFSSITFRNYSDANYIPTNYTIHVSNDMNTWYNVIPSTATGYVENGMFGNMPIDAYATYPNRTTNAIFSIEASMPDSNEYYTYVRLGFLPTTSYRAIISGCWIGMSYQTDFSSSIQTAKELIFEKKDFINTETSGINAAVIRKKIGTAYQVRFLDKLGYVATAPEAGVVDSTGKTLAPNDEQIYKDERLQNTLETQRLAYQTQCKTYLKNDCNYTIPIANNIGQYQEATWRYSGCANTGTVANSYSLLQSDTTTYDFANGLLESSFIISFINKARVGYFYIQNNTTSTYSAQQIKVYGTIAAGSFDGTTSDVTTTLNETAAIWEEIPIINVVNAYNNGDFTYYMPKEQPNTSVLIASNSNDLSGTVTSTDYGAFNVYIAASKAYQQYRVTVQRTTSNRVIQMAIIPKDVWFDPWATPVDSDGNNKPLLVDAPYYPTSSITALPDKSTLSNAIYASSYSASTVYQLYQSDNNSNWAPENSRRNILLQQAFPYAVNMNNILIQHGNDLNYAANYFEYYGTNLTSLATTVLSDTNSLMNWSRLTSLTSKSDMPTSIPVSQKTNTLNLGNKEYGYSYFTAIFRRSINNQIYLDSFKPTSLSYQTYTANSTDYNNASKYVEEWKWTNVSGESGSIREGACYNHPLLQIGDYTSLTPAYVVMKKEDSNKYYTEAENSSGNYLPTGTSVYRTSSMIDNKTMAYENRWMYKFTDLEGAVWYSPGTPSIDGKGNIGSYAYKNIIPKYNTEVYTGIPMTATANSGSENNFTYFASSENSDTFAAWTAFSIANTSLWAGASSSYDNTTGLPVGDAQYVGFISPEALTVQGYTLKARSSNASTPVKWQFQGSNDGSLWTTLDSRTTISSGEEDAEDIPINTEAGSSYYFNNEDSYTQYRWVIEQITPNSGSNNFGLLKVPCLFVLEENPVKIYGVYKLSYTDHNSIEQIAYTATLGSQGQFINNNETIYSDINLSTPITNIWAYQVSDNEHTYYTKIAGTEGSYAPETTMIYEDQDFEVEFGEALLDTWKYTGIINKKYAYTGEQINNFTWDEEEPYNKYIYTGEVANQYKYTGKIEGWTYTGLSKDIYDTVPNIELTLNRDDARKIQKATFLGTAYPVTTSTDLSNTNYYSFTAGDVAGTIVPSGTPLYLSITDDTPTAYADGTSSYVFSSAPSQQRYSYSYLYVKNNSLPDGQNLTGNEQAYQDANLTIPASSTIDLTEYTYTNTYEASQMTSLYHRITEATPIDNYNMGLSFNGSKYTFTCFADSSTADIQEYQNGDLIKSSYQGPDSLIKNSAVIIMSSQNYLTLNLTQSTYSWWTWNNLIENAQTRAVSNIFRLGIIEGSSAAIEQIDPLYPWRVGETSSAATTKIGDPIITLSNEIEANEIWLEGQELPISKYRKLFKVYGNTYGIASDAEHFVVPNFVGRSIWGINEETSFGYIEAGLPNIEGGFYCTNVKFAEGSTGAFTASAIQSGGLDTSGALATDYTIKNSFNASRSSSIYGKSTTVQPASIKVRVKTRYK